MAISKEFLSGSTNGRGIKVVATATAGTTIHQAQNNTTSIDLVFLHATNTHSAAVDLTIEFGGTTSPDDLIKMSLQSGETILAIAGLPINNNLIVKAFASVANVVSIHGYIDRLTP